MLKKLSATPLGIVAWIAAGVIIILPAALWLFSDRKPVTTKPLLQKLTKTVIRKKIVMGQQLADTVVTKKIAAVMTPVKTPAAMITQQNPAAETPTKPLSPNRIEAPQTENPDPPEPAITVPLEKDTQPKTSLQLAAKPAQIIPAPVMAKTAAAEVRREKWLLSQDAAAYTIQVVGVSHEKTMLEFIKNNRWLKENEFAYYKSTFRGKPWYQLLYGIYPTKLAAQIAANNLPENIRQAGPWIRGIAAVQKTIGQLQ